MLQRYGEAEPSAKFCHEQACAMAEAAEQAPSVESKAEILRLAMEWLKLATELGKRAH